MMCEECGERAATFHLTTISGGEKVVRNLCPVCMAKYQKKLPGIDFGNLAGMLAGIMNATKAASQKQEDTPGENAEYANLKCERCGTTFARFQKTGMLGCAGCYAAFHEPLEQMLNRIHGNVQHTGRTPGGAKNDVQLKLSIGKLRQKLAQAIAEEAYEDAATYRDQIRALTQQLEAQSEAKEGVTE